MPCRSASSTYSSSPQSLPRDDEGNLPGPRPPAAMVGQRRPSAPGPRGHSPGLRDERGSGSLLFHPGPCFRSCRHSRCRRREAIIEFRQPASAVSAGCRLEFSPQSGQCFVQLGGILAQAAQLLPGFLYQLDQDLKLVAFSWEVGIRREPRARILARTSLRTGARRSKRWESMVGKLLFSLRFRLRRTERRETEFRGRRCPTSVWEREETSLTGDHQK